MKKILTLTVAAALLAGCSGDRGPQGAAGPAGAAGSAGATGPQGPAAGVVTALPAGLVGVVRDTAGEAVVGATVYLVPRGDIPSTPLDLSTIAAARAATNDEPLEGTILAKGAGYAKAETDGGGAYRIATVAPGNYFVTVVPAASDKAHLPGGSMCRTAVGDAALVGKQVDLKVSTTPSAKAEYVGPSACLNCHGVVHEKQTLHMLGIRPIAAVGPLQDSSRFPKWNDALAKYEGAGTTLYYHAYNATTKDWKVSETDPRIAAPATVVSFTARLFRDAPDGNRYKVTLTNVQNASDPGSPKTYVVEFSYGGGLYKQRYMSSIAGSRYILPIQYNAQAAAGLAGVEPADPATRWTWQQYNAQNWYTENTTTPASSVMKEPAPDKSFDNACAGCHFTGYKLVGNKASAVLDPKGEYDYDGKGLQVMNVSCENCHGPGSEHYYVAGQGKAIVSPSLLTPEREVTICARCHTRVVGNGGVLAAGALTTEAPLGADGTMPVAGISRKEFLTGYVSKIDDGLWTAAAGGDGLHSVKHHQQASDFLKSAKYRNPIELMTCASCHDVHGNSGLDHQLKGALDTSATNANGMCLACHAASFPGTASDTVASRMQQHWKAHGVADVAMGNISCVDCHMPKTAKSGSGLKQASIAGAQYYSGDISSHVFDMPKRSSITTKSAAMMPIAYTNKCGVCHQAAP